MTKTTVPGLEVEELNVEDSFFAMLTHFGAKEQDTMPAGLDVSNFDKNPNTRPAPLEVPDFPLADTEWSRMNARVAAWVKK